MLQLAARFTTGTRRASSLGCRRRALCSKPPDSAPPSKVAAGLAGLAGGGLGSLVGIGGGAVMVPLMTAYARMSQHQAVGTSSAAVAGVGLSGMASFGSAGAVDLLASAALASTAMLTARFGARFTGRFNPVQLQRAFAAFQLAVAPMVPLKGVLVRSSKQSPGDGVGGGGGGGGGSEAAAPPPSSTALSPERQRELLQLAAVGAAAGFASGMFGIGGGVVITPALCLLTDMPHTCVLGTTLASMVPPSLVSAATHAQMGNVVAAAVAPLVAGSAIGAFATAQLALQMPEEPLQWGFALFLVAMGGHKLYSLRGRV